MINDLWDIWADDTWGDDTWGEESTTFNPAWAVDTYAVIGPLGESEE